MTFTDDDLRRLKEHIGECVQCPETRDQVEALIARLEAAEKLNDLLRPLHVHAFPTATGDVCKIVKADEAWRKACGK